LSDSQNIKTAMTFRWPWKSGYI